MSEELHLEVLQQLATILPEDSAVVLLGDGEFDECELQAFCQERGWNYALRTAKSNTITTGGGETFTIGQLYPMPGHNHWLIEGVNFTQEGYGPINCLVWHNSKHDIHKVKIEDPDRLNVLLMAVCIAFLLVFALATFQDKLQGYLPKFLRKDRSSAYSYCGRYENCNDCASFGLFSQK